MSVSVWGIPSGGSGARRLAIALCLLGGLGLGAAGSAQGRAKLVVVVSVDQLGRERLDTKLPGGLGRLAREGRRFVDARLEHALSETAPGHAGARALLES